MATGNTESSGVVNLASFRKEPLSPELEEYWLKRLDEAERAVDYAKRMLGMIALENIRKD